MLYNNKVLLLALDNHTELVLDIAQTMSKGVDNTATFYGLLTNVKDILGMDYMGIRGQI